MQSCYAVCLKTQVRVTVIHIAKFGHITYLVPKQSGLQCRHNRVMPSVTKQGYDPGFIQSLILCD